MTVVNEKFPDDLEERLGYIQGKIDIYRSTHLRGFRSACSNVSQGTYKGRNESEVAQAVVDFNEYIATPYREIDLEKLDDTVEFSFVHTILDLITLFEQSYQNYLNSDNTSGFRDLWQGSMHKKVVAIGGVSSIWEDNLKIYTCELKKVKEQLGR